MLTISKPLSASQVRTYHEREFASERQNYWSRDQQGHSEWQGKLAEQWGLSGPVGDEHFARLTEGQHPHTEAQLVRHQISKTYEGKFGKEVTSVEHRAGWDATFSAPKSVSLTALVGGDGRVREAHRESVRAALNELEKYTQARIGNVHAPETTGKFVAATFEHDTARPVDGYAAPQLHTHAVIFNVTERDNGQTRALQPQELFASQRYATSVYRSELAMRLQGLGYELERGKHGQPEIKGYTKEYLDASSPRREQIKDHLREMGIDGAGAAQVAAHRTRDSKELLSPGEVLLDESSLASTKQMHEFVNRLHPNDHVLLVGDRRQHEAIEAGRPFAQLQDAGMKTVKLEEIVRQKDPELKQVVEQLARGEVREAVHGLERQGRVHEIRGREERIAAIAKEYAKSPEGTLVVSPDNRSRVEINLAIRTEMQERGMVSKDEHCISALVPRQDLTGPERTWAARYEFNDVVRYARASKETGMERGEYARVKSVDAEKNLLTVVRADGSELTYDPRRQQGVSVYREEPRNFAVGDRIQFTSPANDLKVANRELGTVEAIGQDGQMRLKMDGGRDVQLGPREHPHLDHGYAVTSHSSQGQTAERVLIHVDTELAAKDLLNSRMAYVAVSRGANDAQLYTKDRAKLPEALGHDVSHESAHTPAIKAEQAIKPQQEIAPVIEHGVGMGHSL